MQILPKKLSVHSPAKLNLHLAVLDKRADGFHNLESLFLALDFGDTLHFLPVEGETTEITMEMLSEGIPIEKNIIFKALTLFKSKTGFNQGFKINVEKRIPIGSGLGGGSSNAASTLLVLNRLAGFPLTREELLEMAAELGSDVPFFIHETAAAWVTGRGEQVEPLEPPSWFFVLVNPGFPSDTAAAFELLDKNKDLKNSNISDREGKFFNDFLSVFNDPEKSTYNDIILQLLELGAEFSSLSGSGSTCFGAFNNKDKADKAAVSLSVKWNFVKCCNTLSL